jgi:hypothetical protein
MVRNKRVNKNLLNSVVKQTEKTDCEPCASRTRDHLIKSQVLYQLS